MRLYAYYDRFGDERFGVLVEGRLLTGAQLEKRGRLDPAIDTHLGIGFQIGVRGRLARRAPAGDQACAQGRRAAAGPRRPAPRPGDERDPDRQDRVRRPQLRRPREGGRSGGAGPARCCSPSSPTPSSATARPIDPSRGHPRPRPRGGARRRHRPGRPPRHGGARRSTTSPATSSSTTSAPATGRATRRPSARARRATASGCAPRAADTFLPGRPRLRDAGRGGPRGRPRAPQLADPGHGPGRRHAGPDAGRQHGRHAPRRPGPGELHLAPHHARARRPHRHRHARGRRRVPRPAGLPRARRPRAGARSRGSAWWRIRSSTGPRTPGREPCVSGGRPGRRNEGAAHARPGEDRARPGTLAWSTSRTR